MLNPIVNKVTTGV